MSFTVIMIFRLKFGKFSHFVSITMLPLLFPQRTLKANYIKNRSIFDSRHLNCVCGFFLSKFVLGIHRKKIVQTTNFDSFFHNTLHIDEITEIKPKRKKHKKWFEYKWKMFSVDHIFYKMEIFLFHKKIRGGKFAEKRCWTFVIFWKLFNF